MSIRNRITAGVTAAVMSGAMVFGTAQAATAAPATTSVSASAVTTTSSSLTSAPLAQSLTPAPAPAPLPLPAPSAPSAGQVTPAAVPIAIRIAVRAAMEVLKRTNTAVYNNIISWVAKGRTAFINLWNEKVPAAVKGIFGGVAASAIYDAIKWIFGL